MDIENTLTYFDSPERASHDEIFNDYLLFQVNVLISQIMEGFPEFVVILNKHRQIVSFNEKALKLLKVTDPDQILGKRIGEAFGCVHSDLMPGGCGTSQFCRECGTAQAIKFTNDYRKPTEEECHITSITEGKEVSLDFLVHTQPIQFRGQEFILFAIKDISSAKRREVLERIFFHDILNTSGAINGLAYLLQDTDEDEEREKLLNTLFNSSRQLIDEITYQRDIRNAEDGNLQVIPKDINCNFILNTSHEMYANHELAENKILTVDLPDENYLINTDPTLLVRSIGNLIKNALEASSPNDEIKLFATTDKNDVNISVSNKQVMPEQIQLQLFKRSFSTKQKKGRGLGLYSVKLIVEQFLKGRVSFISDNLNGTVFTIHIPKKLS